MPIYGSSGLRTGVKAWIGSVTTTNGAWSVSITAAACTAAPFSVQSQALSTAQTAAGAVQANVSSVSATSVAGSVTQPSTLSALGVLSLSLFTAQSTTVFVEAFCN